MKYLLFMLFAWCSQAATYYIAPAASGGSDSNDGSEGSPWLTCTKVTSTITNGDTVYFRAGVWSNQLFHLISKTNVILAAYTGESPMLSGCTTDNYSPRFSGCSNVTWDGITVSNQYRTLGIYTSSVVQIYNCSLGWQSTNTGDQDGRPAIYLEEAYSCILSNLYITRCGRIDASTTNDEGDLVRFGNDNSSKNASLNRLLNSTLISGGHETLGIQGSSNVVRGCTFYNDNWLDNPVTGGTNGNRLLEFLGDLAVGNLVESNRFGYTGNPSDQPNYVWGIEICAGPNTIRNNSIFSMRGGALALYYKAQSGASAVEGCRIFHNTLFITGTDSTTRTDNRDGLRLIHAYETNNYIVNNLCYGIRSNSIAYASGNAANLQARVSGNFLDTADPVFSNTNCPGQTTTETPVLTLQSDSPCIDAGVWLSTITTATGSGTEFDVADAGYFYDGWGIPGEVGDTIQLEGKTTTAMITSISGNTITVDSTLTWTQGDGVALPYSGAAPDQGAYEYATPSGLITPTGTGNYTISGSGSGTVIISAE